MLIVKKILIKLFRVLGLSKRYAIFTGVSFGKNCKFSNKIDFGSEPYLVTIGNDFYCSANITFITHDGAVNVIRNLYSAYNNIDSFNTIVLGDNVFLGFGVTILPGSLIGDNVIVGANSLVKGTLLSDSVYAGSPARYLCSIESYHERNKHKYLRTKHLKPDDKEAIVKEILK
jgi:acetyltransferase-like isoleucine patch superfamily enzyme